VLPRHSSAAAVEFYTLQGLPTDVVTKSQSPCDSSAYSSAGVDKTGCFTLGELKNIAQCNNDSNHVPAMVGTAELASSPPVPCLPNLWVCDQLNRQHFRFRRMLLTKRRPRDASQNVRAIKYRRYTLREQQQKALTFNANHRPHRLSPGRCGRQRSVQTALTAALRRVMRTICRCCSRP
jgi:hypothetical protein